MSIEAMKKMLEALEFAQKGAQGWTFFLPDAITAGRQAIEQASSVSSIQSDKTSDAEKQAPFGYLWPTGRHPEFRFTQQLRDGVEGTPVYTLQPQQAEKQEPVAWMHTKIEGVAVPHRPADLDKHPDRWESLYKTPPPCPTCEALARTVMIDQTGRDA